MLPESQSFFGMRAFLLLLLSSPSFAVPVANFQPDGVATINTFVEAKDLTAFDLRANFTICLWFRLFNVNGWKAADSTLLSIAFEGSGAYNALILGN